jgi:hypothetical protein
MYGSVILRDAIKSSLSEYEKNYIAGLPRNPSDFSSSFLELLPYSTKNQFSKHCLRLSSDVSSAHVQTACVSPFSKNTTVENILHLLMIALAESITVDGEQAQGSNENEMQFLNEKFVDKLSYFSDDGVEMCVVLLLLFNNGDFWKALNQMQLMRRKINKNLETANLLCNFFSVLSLLSYYSPSVSNLSLNSITNYIFTKSHERHLSGDSVLKCSLESGYEESSCVEHSDDTHNFLTNSSVEGVTGEADCLLFKKEKPFDLFSFLSNPFDYTIPINKASVTSDQYRTYDNRILEPYLSSVTFPSSHVSCIPLGYTYEMLRDVNSSLVLDAVHSGLVYLPFHSLDKPKGKEHSKLVCADEKIHNDRMELQQIQMMASAMMLLSDAQAMNDGMCTHLFQNDIFKRKWREDIIERKREREKTRK